MTRTILIMILLLTLAACADNAIRKQAEDLDSAINNYAYALRWMRKDDAVAFHRQRDGSKPVIDTSMMNVIRVTGFTIKEKTLNGALDSATVTSELSYYHNEYATLKMINFSQSWWYEPETKKWYLESEFPQFK